MCGQKLAWLKV